MHRQNIGKSVERIDELCIQKKRRYSWNLNGREIKENKNKVEGWNLWSNG